MDCLKCGATGTVSGGFCSRCGAPATGAVCQYGHVQDPSWKDCAICHPAVGGGSASGSKGRTVVEDPGARSGRRGFTAGAELLRRPIPSGKGDTEFAAQDPRKARTVYDGGTKGAEPVPEHRAQAQRPRLVGWIVSFGKDPSGTDLRIREGRNQIGAADDCEVQILGDATLSGKHAVIMCRDGKLQIRDNDSVNGTYVNDEDIFGKGPVVLENGARIRLGGSEWVLHLIGK